MNCNLKLKYKMDVEIDHHNSILSLISQYIIMRLPERTTHQHQSVFKIYLCSTQEII